MKTEDLITTLAAETKAVPPGALLRRLLIAVLAGSAVTLACVAALFGLRPDLSVAAGDPHFWMKATFTMGVAAVGLIAVERAGRPGVRFAWQLALVTIPLAFIFAIAASELASTPSSDRVPLWLGQTWRGCSFSIVALAVPPLALLLVALRRLAPTRPASAGFAAGLLAGGVAATAYGLHCPEMSAAFVASWYALGIVGCGALGAVIGRRVLRW